MNFKYKKIILLIIMLFLFKIDATVKAEVEITNNGLSFGSDSECPLKNGYVACYYPKFQFRVTLVDKNGKKVANTNSVDFSYSKDGKTKINSKVVLNGKEFDLINSNYKYRYSNSHENDTNSHEKFKYITLKLVEDPDEYKQKENGRDDPDQYNEFYDKFSERIVDKIQDVKFDDRSGAISDFLSVFLYHSGYIGTQININDNLEKAKEIADNNYYLLIEPTYMIYYNETANSSNYQYVYGTATEILEMMISKIEQRKEAYINNGYLSGLSANFVYQTGCNMYTDDVGKFERITKKTECIGDTDLNKLNTKNLPSREQRITIMNSLLDSSAGYGVSVLSLSNLLPGPSTVTTPITLNLDLNCEDDGEISLKYLDDEYQSPSDKDFVKSDLFSVGSATENSKLYCYDEVKYDFEEILKLGNQKYKYFSAITIPEVEVYVVRNCYFRSKTASRKDANDFDDYTGKEIKINIFNEVLNLNYDKTEIDKTIDNTNVVGMGWVKYQKKFIFKYKNQEGKSTISLKPGNDYNSKGTVEISKYSIQNLFGSSNNIVRKLIESKKGVINQKNNDQENPRNFIYGLEYANGEEINQIKCSFEYEIDDDTPDSSDTSYPGSDTIKFRTISLSNPFPARDGTSRLPGSNWLNKENYVYDYINNNRAIQYKRQSTTDNPELMYLETEPMYTVTLDPATMMKIRQYNSQNTYDYINLACNNDNRECQSIFLRNTYFIPSDNLSGVCSDSSNFHKVVETIDENIKESDIRANLYGENPIYKVRYDFNKNYRMDTEDLDIFLNKEKNTGFYTCADKTYKSGG